jgi:hypothetical protein
MTQYVLPLVAILVYYVSAYRLLHGWLWRNHHLQRIS